MVSLNNGKCFLESLWKILEFFVQKRVPTLYNFNTWMGESKMWTADWLWTIVFRVRKQWDYCYILICMVKTIVFSLHFSLTVPQYLSDDHHTMHSYSQWFPLILIPWLIDYCTPFIALFLSYNCGGRILAIQLEHWTFKICRPQVQVPPFDP